MIRKALILFAVFSLLLIATDLAQGRICLSNLRINHTSPIKIHCGSTKTLSCSVDYVIDNGGMNWGNCWTIAAPRNFTAQLYDDDGWWGNELYRETVITIPATPSSGTVDFTIDVPCTWDEDCSDCEVNGDEHEAELFIAFWKELVGLGSPVKKAECTCTVCSKAMSLDDFDGFCGQHVVTEMMVDSLFTDVSLMELKLDFEPGCYELTNIFFHNPILESAVTVIPMADGVQLVGHFEPPFDFMPGPFVTLELAVLPGAPWGENAITNSHETHFLNYQGDEIHVCIPDARGHLLPFNTIPPDINPEQIDLSPCYLIGHPGAIIDQFLEMLPQYVGVDAIYQPTGELMGSVVVNPDGSFLFPYLNIPPGSPVEIIAHNRGGNYNVIALPVSEMCDCNHNSVPDQLDVDSGDSFDCNANGVPDECDIAYGLSDDENENGIPDECDGQGLDPEVELPVAGLMLSQNHPNPFTSSTSLRYFVSERAPVTLTIYSVEGSLVRTLIDEVQSPRNDGHLTTWDGTDNTGRSVSSGEYFVRFNSGELSQTRKIILFR